MEYAFTYPSTAHQSQPERRETRYVDLVRTHACATILGLGTDTRRDLHARYHSLAPVDHVCCPVCRTRTRVLARAMRPAAHHQQRVRPRSPAAAGRTRSAVGRGGTSPLPPFGSRSHPGSPAREVECRARTGAFALTVAPRALPILRTHHHFRSFPPFPSFPASRMLVFYPPPGVDGGPWLPSDLPATYARCSCLPVPVPTHLLEPFLALYTSSISPLLDLSPPLAGEPSDPATQRAHLLESWAFLHRLALDSASRILPQHEGEMGVGDAIDVFERWCRRMGNEPARLPLERALQVRGALFVRVAEWAGASFLFRPCFRRRACDADCWCAEKLAGRSGCTGRGRTSRGGPALLVRSAFTSGTKNA